MWGLRWLSGLAAVFREFRRRADLDHVAPTGKGRERKPQPEAKRRDRVSTRRSEPLAGRSAVIQSAVLATELTEDGTAARPSDDPARQPRGERPQPRPARLSIGPAAQGKRSAQRRQARRREGWKPAGARRHRRLDAKHDSPARAVRRRGTAGRSKQGLLIHC